MPTIDPTAGFRDPARPTAFPDIPLEDKMARSALIHPIPLPHTPAEAARAYDEAGETYRAYADGDRERPFHFNGAYAFADREIWQRLDATLVQLRTAGRHAVRILDAGCGPGTWLIRLALRARQLGFTAIEGRGFDISEHLIDLARDHARSINDETIGLAFDVADIRTATELEDEESFDIVLCLYGVFNHLDQTCRTVAAAELSRVCASDLFVTARAVGSTPTIYISELTRAARFAQDNGHDRLAIDLVDGRHIDLDSHLFDAAELRGLFAASLLPVETVGLDLFHDRFAPRANWNPPSVSSAPIGEWLERLEHLCAHDPAFIDFAAHILVHARSASCQLRDKT